MCSIGVIAQRHIPRNTIVFLWHSMTGRHQICVVKVIQLQQLQLVCSVRRRLKVTVSSLLSQRWQMSHLSVAHEEASTCEIARKFL